MFDKRAGKRQRLQSTIFPESGRKLHLSVIGDGVPCEIKHDAPIERIRKKIRKTHEIRENLAKNMPFFLPNKTASTL